MEVGANGASLNKGTEGSETPTDSHVRPGVDLSELGTAVQQSS